ncbi:hypothetical protein/hypothetical protein [Amycolatopsis rubida]|uniref:Short chain dehydrogenase n=1 Tax=Amycolatopsis rubida TaxID=112413 RepID=A0A1I5LAS2_9PSEU|nr:hypothetical protein/hypothetical protein [Amycolatopsis rubida]
MLSAIREVTDGLLISNAGANSYGHEFVTGDLSRVRGVLDPNITAHLALTHHFGALMAARGRGGIVLVGSLAGYLGQAEISVYSAVKAFGRVLAEGLWLEMRDRGMDVLELVLGVTRTPAMERAGLAFDLPGLNVAESEDVWRASRTARCGSRAETSPPRKSEAGSRARNWHWPRTRRHESCSPPGRQQPFTALPRTC